MPDLTREEVERRLAKLHDTMALVPPLARNIHAVAEREALQTAQSLYAKLERQRDSWQREVELTEAERDELKGQCVRWEAMYEGMMAERDGYWEERDKLTVERDQLAAEGRVLREALDFVCNHGICSGIHCTDEEYREGEYCDTCSLLLGQKCCRLCPIEQALHSSPLVTAEVARVKRLEAVAEELTVMHDEYGKADDETLTPDAITLKSAINRVWDELERMCPDALAAWREGEG